MTVEAAITKIQTEMNSNEKDRNYQLVGNFLIQRLQANPLEAEKILGKNKSIKNAFADMRKVAEKNKNGNVGVVDPVTGFNMILKHFGIKEELSQNEFFNLMQSKPVVKSTITPPSQETASRFKTNLDDYL